MSSNHPKLNDSEKQKLYLEGIRVFNKEEFYECHEVLEKLWLQDNGPSRLFYQGIIQVASSFHHVQKGRLKPARKVLQLAIEKLESYPDSYRGIRLDQLRKEIKEWRKLFDKTLNEGASFSVPLFPKINSNKTKNSF